MGRYTRYWEAYSRARVRRGPRIVAGIVAAVIARLALGALDVCPSWLLDILVFGTSAILIARWVGRDYYDVICPECGARCGRTGLGIEKCPKCGLLFMHPGR